MKLLLTIICWCVLLLMCWPLAILVLVLFPLVWLLVLPFRLAFAVVESLLALVKAILMLPTRLLRHKS